MSINRKVNASLWNVSEVEALKAQVFALTGEVANKAEYAASMYLMHQDEQAHRNELLQALEALVKDAQRVDEAMLSEAGVTMYDKSALANAQAIIQKIKSAP